MALGVVTTVARIRPSTALGDQGYDKATQRVKPPTRRLLGRNRTLGDLADVAIPLAVLHQLRSVQGTEPRQRDLPLEPVGHEILGQVLQERGRDVLGRLVRVVLFVLERAEGAVVQEEAGAAQGRGRRRRGHGGAPEAIVDHDRVVVEREVSVEEVDPEVLVDIVGDEQCPEALEMSLRRRGLFQNRRQRVINRVGD